jgi:hypothetical protein
MVEGKVDWPYLGVASLKAGLVRAGELTSLGSEGYNNYLNPDRSTFLEVERQGK